MPFWMWQAGNSRTSDQPQFSHINKPLSRQVIFQQLLKLKLEQFR
jgi:hypothetical protein